MFGLVILIADRKSACTKFLKHHTHYHKGTSDESAVIIVYFCMTATTTLHRDRAGRKEGNSYCRNGLALESCDKVHGIVH